MKDERERGSPNQVLADSNSASYTLSMFTFVNSHQTTSRGGKEKG